MGLLLSPPDHPGAIAEKRNRNAHVLLSLRVDFFESNTQFSLIRSSSLLTVSSRTRRSSGHV